MAFQELADVPRGVAVLGWAQEYTASHNFKSVSLTDAATINWDLSSAQVAKVTLAGNRTLANPTNMRDGGVYILLVTQDGTGSRTLGYGSAYKFPGNANPVLTTTANRTDVLTFISDGTRMLGSFVLNFSA